MALTKLTLSVDEQVIAWARELARSEQSSISSMFSRYVQGLRSGDQNLPAKLGPLTREALAIGHDVRQHLPRGAGDKELLVQALAEKYGVDL
jgi:hypothetical protein